MKLVRAIVAVSALVATASFAKGAHPSHGKCMDAAGKEVKAKSEKACTKAYGTWTKADAAKVEAAPAAAPAEAAPAK